MAKIKVEGFTQPKSPYNTVPARLPNYSVGFALCSSPKTGRKQVSKFETCKAFLQDAIASYLHCDDTGKYRYYDKATMPPIDMNKLRLLVGRSEADGEFKKKLYAAKRVVNFYEGIAGWKPSKIAEVDHSIYPRGVWLITGPKQWMSTPHLLSMVTLIIRKCTTSGPVEFKNNGDLEKIYKEWIKSSGNDVHYMKSCWNKLFLVAKHHDKLFKGFEPKDLHIEANSHANGIQYLCDFMAFPAELNRRFKKICEENGVK